MKIYYSPSQRGFFRDDVHAPEAIPNDAVEITGEQHQALLQAQCEGKRIEPDAEGQPQAVAQPELSPEERLVHLKRQVSAHLNTVARQRGYDSLASALSYADDPGEPTWQAEAQALRTWRTRVWQRFFELTAAELPAVDELLAALPTYPIVEG